MFFRVLLLIVAISAFTTAYAKEPTDEQLDQFFTLKGAPHCYDSAMASIYMPLAAMLDGGNFKVKNKDKAVRVADKVIAEFKWENIKPAVYKFYRSNYTYEEIEAYIKLLSRPEFRVMIAKETALSEEYDKVLQSITFQNMLNIILQVELEKKSK
jgi:arsenate reductase-like glutaredoxin family protein